MVLPTVRIRQLPAMRILKCADAEHRDRFQPKVVFLVFKKLLDLFWKVRLDLPYATRPLYTKLNN